MSTTRPSRTPTSSRLWPSSRAMNCVPTSRTTPSSVVTLNSPPRVAPRSRNRARRRRARPRPRSSTRFRSRPKVAASRRSRGAARPGPRPSRPSPTATSRCRLGAGPAAPPALACARRVRRRALARRIQTASHPKRSRQQHRGCRGETAAFEPHSPARHGIPFGIDGTANFLGVGGRRL